MIVCRTGTRGMAVRDFLSIEVTEALNQLEVAEVREAGPGVGRLAEDLGIAILEDHARCPRVEEIARQDGAAIAPDRVDRRPTPAQIRHVHHIVVDQGGGVEQFDGGRDANPARSRVATQLGG